MGRKQKVLLPTGEVQGVPWGHASTTIVNAERECSTVVVCKLPKLETRVRFPPLAQI